MSTLTRLYQALFLLLSKLLQQGRELLLDRVLQLLTTSSSTLEDGDPNSLLQSPPLTEGPLNDARLNLSELSE